MDEVENVNITETPRITINASSRNSHDSVDSGYLTLLSPPPSPSVPSSSFIASEPIEEDVEMKLVIVPQSTPQVTTSPRRKTPPPPPRIVISPTCRKASPAISSADNQKLSKLSITYLAAIKPKRLDFSHRVISAALHHSRATPDYTGRETVDILALLGDKSNHWRIVSKILSFLGPQDLCSISMVSKTWRRICFSDSRANVRRLTHIILRQNAKENLKLIKKSKIEGDIQSSPRSRYARKGYLLEVQNLLQVQGNKRPPSSPPVSPSKVKFHSFVKASRTLAPWEHLLPCPKCSFPCHVDGEKNVGTCSRQGCSMEFCTSCSSRPHTGPCKTPLLATPTKRNKRLVIGSKQSKRNLRRL
ncbi:F-box only protein 43-like isoform X1 [Apis dorsata]|uniref:F-box only protein 43-like isoform X1 n=1 Tax=Apis mellifera TaxID=7460 RepID=A0A7M7INM3_APIME|nr:F-box only protein 43-like isoform X1 [Apis dorsata]XP_016772904.2 F-box only protein 43-like isoform X1 [Apis mellifera]XP_016910788.1 F-box only protein 43-like isoform X1 [Apis cerana]KAG6801744.1 F-box only protein 43-like isoform X1 [Apis mellifera caucasica]KAG9428765.1 F-box only protein 43-like isoform X1 [Apis mellifera carnica]|eukprot:XP_016772904.2 F-box only protein 43-like isoform X1 [Apis mellifera]